MMRIGLLNSAPSAGFAFPGCSANCLKLTVDNLCLNMWIQDSPEPVSVITRTCLKGYPLMNSRRKLRLINDPAVANEMKQIKGKHFTSMLCLNPLTGHPLTNTAWCIQSMLLKGILIPSICLRKCVWLQNNNVRVNFFWPV